MGKLSAKPLIDGPNWRENLSRLIDPEKPILVYKNLHKEMFSVKQGTKVICHVPYIFLSDVSFIVNVKGRERVRRENAKNVHAFVKGFLASPRLVDHLNPIGEASYNPYTCDTFVLRENNGLLSPLHMAQFADIYVPSSVIVW